MPPTCWVTWRGKPRELLGQLDQVASRAARPAGRRTPGMRSSSSPSRSTPWRSLSLAILSSRPAGMPSTLPTSRTALRRW